MTNQSFSIDGEINLIPYVMAVLRRWPWVLMAALLGALLAGALALRTPRSYTATASIIFVGERAELYLDPRFQPHDRLPPDTVGRRAALQDFADAPIIESYLPADLIEAVAPPDYEAGDLAPSIEVEQYGDLLRISANASSAEKAQQLANGWAQAYTRYVNRTMLGVDESQLEEARQKVAEAEAAYAAIQADYSASLVEYPLDRLENEIKALESLLDSSTESHSLRYAERLRRVDALDLLRQDATALRDQLAEEGSSLNESLAATLLRARAVGPLSLTTASGATNGEMALLQVALTAPTTPLAPDELRADLDRLIDSLEAQRAALLADIAEAESALQTDAPPAASTLDLTAQAALYDRLADLRREHELARGLQEQLLTERNVIAERLTVLNRALAELEINRAESGAVLRFLGEAILPQYPASRGVVGRTIMGGVAGAIFGIFLAVLAALPWPSLVGGRPRRQPSAS